MFSGKPLILYLEVYGWVVWRWRGNWTKKTANEEMLQTSTSHIDYSKEERIGKEVIDMRLGEKPRTLTFCCRDC